MEFMLTTWNVNGIRARIENVTEWLDSNNPDILCLQEIKCLEKNFPKDIFTSRGYNVYLVGQKSFNGVAIISKFLSIETKKNIICASNDTQSRSIECTFEINSFKFIVCCIYLPNGNPIDTDKFTYKIEWMDNLKNYIKKELAKEIPYAVLGDFNVIPTRNDVKNYEEWIDDAIFNKLSIKKYRELVNIGLYDCHKLKQIPLKQYTQWDYQRGAWQNNNGVRIDHILLSSYATRYLTDYRIDENERSKNKPSDHVPVTAILNIA
jgi:exodeoxyribonuclease III